MPLPEGLSTKIETDYSCQIKKIENLKSGSNGTVYHLTTVDGRELCIKEVAIDNKSGEMDYKYAVKMFGGTDYSVSKYDDVSSSHYYVILPFFPGKPLTQFLPNKKFVNLTMPDITTLQQRKIIFAKILIKMEEMHARGIIHRDLKSDNIIVNVRPDGEVEVHIIDFGRSVDPFDHVTGKATATLEDLSLRSTTTAWYQFYYLTQIVRWLTQPQTAKELTSLWSADLGDVSFRTDYASLPHLYRDLLPDCPDMASDLATKHGTDRTRAYCKFLWKYLKQVNLGHECERFTSIDAIITAIKREKALVRQAVKSAIQQEKSNSDAIQSSYSSTSPALYTSESKTSVSSGSDTDTTLDAAVDKILDDTNELGLDNNVAGAVDVILQIHTEIISEEDRIHIIKEDRAVSPSFFSAVLAITSFSTSAVASEYMLINANHYRQTVASARSQISAYLSAMAPMRNDSLNTQVETIVNSLLDSPYMSTGAMGEGDWVSTSPTYKPGAVHIDQDPVYRLDGLDCQTFVQMVMGLLYSNNLNEFDANMIKIAYGAVDLTEKSQIRYYNRNHFVDADFNRVNQYRGFLQDVTSTGVLSEYAKKTNATVSLYDWLAKQRENPQNYVRVLNDRDGIFMMKNFMLDYQDLDIDKVKERVVSISYLPKATLAIKQSDNSYQPNQGLLDLIPTPAIAEIVCDAKSWTIGGRNIKDVIGTEMSVSHFGVLYRKTFAKNAVIYRRISCSYNKPNKPCQVTPVVCDQDECKELMFAHATDGYPASHYWYQLADGNYTCTAKKPAKGAKYTMCNRVEALPFFSYITNNQDGAYWYMNTPSILGVHIEKLLARH